MKNIFNKILIIVIIALFSSCSGKRKHEMIEKNISEYKELLSYYNEKKQENSKLISCITDSLNIFYNSLSEQESNNIKKNKSFLLKEKKINDEIDSIILGSDKIADSINKSFKDINLFFKNCSSYNYSVSIINDGWLCYYDTTSDMLLRYSKQLKKLKETVRKRAKLIDELKK